VVTGENPPEIVPGGDLSGFIKRNGLSVNKLFVATDSRHSGVNFDALLAAIEAAAAGRAEILPDRVTWFSETTGAVEVMPLGQSKAQGMAFVLERLGESADQVRLIDLPVIYAVNFQCRFPIHRGLLKGCPLVCLTTDASDW